MPGEVFRPQLDEPHHHAYVVEDIEAAVNRLADQFGAGPFFLIENVPVENVISRGEPAEFAHHSAFGQCGDAAIEVMQAVSLAPERVANAFSGPLPRLQHVGYVVPPPEVEALRGALDERGLTQYLSIRVGGAETTMHDARETLGHDLEIHADNDALRDFFAMVRAAADDWDGSDPLRPVET